ncbi:hypothetical protein PspLS_05097 [Pyricularia sp. CBS 133598]|nr:hypothetical protein PspLS_05097 [Pyricularia sp. CBS 133598]
MLGITLSHAVRTHASEAHDIQFTATSSRPRAAAQPTLSKERRSTNSSPPMSALVKCPRPASGSRKSWNKYRCGSELCEYASRGFQHTLSLVTHSSLGPGARYCVKAVPVEATSCAPCEPGAAGLKPVTTQCLQFANLLSLGYGASGSTINLWRLGALALHKRVAQVDLLGSKGDEEVRGGSEAGWDGPGGAGGEAGARHRGKDRGGSFAVKWHGGRS